MDRETNRVLSEVVRRLTEGKMDKCGKNCRGIRRKAYCSDRTCGAGDCKCCHGEGVDHSDCDPCPSGCDNGQLPCDCDDGGPFHDLPCDKCLGDGFLPCPDCGGEG